MGITTATPPAASDSSTPKATTKASSNVVNIKSTENAENLAIWDLVKDTDKSFVKPMFSANGSNLSSINPNYQVLRATNLFGPCGIGWGYEVTSESYIQGPSLYPERPEAGNHTLHVVQVKLWYKHKGEIGAVSHFGQTKLSSVDASGKVIFDEDAPKKSLTDGISKCLSMLGFSADIYGGQFDGSQQNNTTANTEPSSGKSSTAPTASSTAPALEPTPESIKLSECKTLDELKKVWGTLTDVQRTVAVNKQAKEDIKARLT